MKIDPDKLQQPKAHKCATCGHRSDKVAMSYRYKKYLCIDCLRVELLNDQQ